MPLRAMSKLRFPCPSALLHLSSRGWGGDGRGRPRGTSDPLRPIGSPTTQMAYGHKTEHGCGSVHRWCCTPRMDAPTHASPGTRGCVWIPCAAGVSSSPGRARPGSETVNAAAVPPRSPRCRPPRRRALEAVHVDAEAGAVVDGGGAQSASTQAAMQKQLFFSKIIGLLNPSSMAAWTVSRQGRRHVTPRSRRACPSHNAGRTGILSHGWHEGRKALRGGQEPFAVDTHAAGRCFKEPVGHRPSRPAERTPAKNSHLRIRRGSPMSIYAEPAGGGELGLDAGTPDGEVGVLRVVGPNCPNEMAC